MNNAVVTNKGKEKLVKARAGLITLPAITQVAFGDAGATSEGLPIAPSGSANSLNNEVLKVDVETKTVSGSVCTYTVQISADQAIGKKISELALVDSEGDLIAIKCFRPKIKDEGIPMIFEITDEIL